MTKDIYKKTYIAYRILFPMFVLLLVLAHPPAIIAQEINAAPRYEPQNPARLSHPDTDRWSYLADGLQVSFGSVDQRYDRDLVPMFEQTDRWEGTAWRGEKINMQLLRPVGQSVRYAHRGSEQGFYLP